MTEYKRLTYREGNRIGVIDMTNGIESTNSQAVCRLAELEDKLESGQLVGLPCNVGDTVWYVNTAPSISLAMNTVYEGHVARFHVLNYPQPLGTVVCADIQIHNRYGTTEVLDIKDLGKSWFLTMEQAEARLKELKENQ